MSALFLLRLGLDLVAAGLLVFGLAYWWLGNGAHELAGAAFFTLLITHNLFNRRFYGRLARTGQTRRGAFNVALTFVLLLTMAALLITSVLISHALAPVMAAIGGFTVRQIHTLAAYWALVIVAIHLGLRWPMIMGAARALTGFTAPNAARAWTLRLLAVAIAAHGVWSSSVLGMGTRLTMRMTLDWWNFEESAAGFFVHCIAVAGLYVVLTYYGLMVAERFSRDSVKHRPAA